MRSNMTLGSHRGSVTVVIRLIAALSIGWILVVPAVLNQGSTDTNDGLTAVDSIIVSDKEATIDGLQKPPPHRRLEESNNRSTRKTDPYVDKVIPEHLQEFARSPEIEVVGPSSFPKPTDKAKKSWNDDIVVTLKPALGQHRPEKDAVLLLAAQYNVDVYARFIESLVQTGYDGDIVLSVNESDLKNAQVYEYLSYYANGRGVVVYTPRQVCFTGGDQQVASANGGILKCKLHGLYGRRNPETGDIELLDDPREPRTLQNIRYETYWVMANAYSSDSWIMLVDSRDTVFQTNPFADVPRKTDPSGKSGVLYLFGENMDASRIIKSLRFNYRWISAAYGEKTANSIRDKPILCSGSTMGETIAVETYLRAMVAEADETGTILKGSDQGFHIRLYYSNKLKNADKIHSVVVFDQGAGIINNLAVLRYKELNEWGNGKIINDQHSTILNWDGTVR